jgi:hypothetical protein
MGSSCHQTRSMLVCQRFIGWEQTSSLPLEKIYGCNNG